MSNTKADDATGPVENAVELPNRKRWATSDEFDNYRAVITRLYVKENRTLKNVMETMQRDFDFHASPKMYKSRFKRWGVAKYLKSAGTMQATYHSKGETQDVSSSTLSLRAKIEGFQRVGGYLGSKERPRLPKLAPNRASPPSTTDLVAMAPLFDIFGPRLTVNIPSPFFKEESTYHAVKTYYDTSFTALSTWTEVAPSTGIIQLKPSLLETRRQLDDLHGRFRIAMNKISAQPPAQSDLVEGLKIMRIVFARLPDVLSSENPILMTHILDMIRRLQEAKQPFLENQLRRHILWLARAPGQPRSTSLMASILSTGLPLDRPHLTLFSQIIAESFQQHLGPWHFQTLQLCLWVLFNRDENTFLRGYGMRQLYARLEAGEGKNVFDDRHLDILMNLASMHLRAGFPQEAVKIVDSVLSEPFKLAALRKYPDIAYNFYWLIGKGLGKQGDYVGAEGHIREALGIAEQKMTAGNRDDAELISGMTALELNLRDQGRDEDADAVLARRQAHIRDSLEIVGESEDAA